MRNVVLMAWLCHMSRILFIKYAKYAFILLVAFIIYVIYVATFIDNNCNICDPELMSSRKVRPVHLASVTYNVAHLKRTSIQNKKKKGLVLTRQNFQCIPTATDPSFDICVYEPDRDKYISASLLTTRLWEPYITESFQAALDNYPSSVVLDVGANIGYYTLLAAKMKHKVIAIEPVADSITRLQEALLENQLENSVTSIKAAIYHNCQSVTMTTSRDNQGGIWIDHLAVTKNDNNGKNTKNVVKTLTLNQIACMIPPAKELIIKLDIEGFECLALQSSRRLLTSVNVPYIFMEWQMMYKKRTDPNSACPESSMARVTEYLVSLGYVPHEVRTGFQLDPSKSTSNWRIGDVYWQKESAVELKQPY